jgi:3-deoxy-manno-octulosonate cytidylyltransferase (CMP-KDO synthetase)
MPPAVVIPSRLGSTRLPNKAISDICGEPMIVHVWRRAMAANVGPVIVACGDQRIYDIVTTVGADAYLTDPTLPSGSDRAFHALLAADPEFQYDPIIVLQGDLPTIDPAAVRAVIEPLERSAAVDVATLATLIRSEEEADAPSVVKVALVLSPPDRVGRALFFSRARIPSGPGPLYHHVGIYAYRRNALTRFIGLPPGVIERRERLEQLRALEAGMRIDVALVDAEPLGVDTFNDLERARDLVTAEREAAAGS